MMIDEKMFCHLVGVTLESNINEYLKPFDLFQLLAIQQFISKRIFQKMAEIAAQQEKTH